MSPRSERACFVRTASPPGGRPSGPFAKGSLTAAPGRIRRRTPGLRERSRWGSKLATWVEPLNKPGNLDKAGQDPTWRLERNIGNSGLSGCVEYAEINNNCAEWEIWHGSDLTGGEGWLELIETQRSAHREADSIGRHKSLGYCNCCGRLRRFGLEIYGERKTILIPGMVRPVIRD